MPLTVPLAQAREACAASIDAFVSDVETLSERDEASLLVPSRCLGWTRLDVVVHVLAGWQEMLQGLVCEVDEAPTVDAASYWPAFAVAEGGHDPEVALLGLMAQRRRTAAYARPASAVAHLRDVAASLRHGVEACTDRPRRWQGHVFSAGDFLAVWAVEDVVHHLDLDLGGAPQGVPTDALRLAGATVEALAGEPLAAAWTDVETVLAGCGRVDLPAGAPAALPVLG